jgi:hypothetical protein
MVAAAGFDKHHGIAEANCPPRGHLSTTRRPAAMAGLPLTFGA